MTREQYLESVKDIIIHKNPYGQYHQQNFDTYGLYGEMTPINSDIINDMPDSQIILSEEVYEMLLAVQDVTNSTKPEFPFFLYGKEVSMNVIELNEFMSSSNNIQSIEASFNQDNAVFKNKQVGLISCLVTSTGDINFAFYDNVNNNFYRFTNVFVKDKNNNMKPVNCYGLN